MVVNLHLPALYTSSLLSFIKVFFRSTCTRDSLEKSDCILFRLSRESAHRIIASFPLHVAEREPSINLEMDHPAPRSIPTRSSRPIERVDSRVPFREEDTAHVKYHHQVFGFRDGAARPSVRGARVKCALFLGDIRAELPVTRMPVK